MQVDKHEEKNHKISLKNTATVNLKYNKKLKQCAVEKQNNAEPSLLYITQNMHFKICQHIS